MSLTNSDMADLVALRRELHRFPELSGEESQTARRITRELSAHPPDELVTGLGGHGLAAVYQGTDDGPTVLFRCELDALPIHDVGPVNYRSIVDGKGHHCGHDGHMAIMAGLARRLSRRRPCRGRAVLLFQPAEETGAGAAAVIADPGFPAIAPDYAFSLHNMPGLPLGSVGLVEGPVNCASCGLRLRLSGKAAHASNPESGVSPMAALSKLMPALSDLSHGTLHDADFALVTVTHAQMGEPAFGIAPGEATVLATLRTRTDDGMNLLSERALSIASMTAQACGLTVDHEFDDVFLHCENDPEATAILRQALDAIGLPHGCEGQPWRASEDFGRFGQFAHAAMCVLGAGCDHPALHNPDYDFPDDLIAPGVMLFERVARDLLG
ncbi:amidohydrolase [Roseovarius salis]|uniref:amidohydrolase n=1 Tax=Roseovarius salis TaxID=3376063 RepID=UPI0037C556A9